MLTIMKMEPICVKDVMHRSSLQMLNLIQEVDGRLLMIVLRDLSKKFKIEMAIVQKLYAPIVTDTLDTFLKENVLLRRTLDIV